MACQRPLSSSFSSSGKSTTHSGLKVHGSRRSEQVAQVQAQFVQLLAGLVGTTGHDAQQITLLHAEAFGPLL
jgi:hypothetical protein